MNIFITGATGYIGGSVGRHLAAAGHAIRGLARDASKSAALRAIGIEPVIGTLDDGALLRDEAARADAVVNCASSDHRPAIEALIEDLGEQGKILLHTSGSSQVGDAAAGNVLNVQVFDEDTPLVVGAEKWARYELDQRILAAPGIRGTVVCNTLIYGHGTGLQPDSVQIPALVKQARQSGVLRLVGRGINRWATVHLDDVCALYQLALERPGTRGFYFAENGESSYADMGQAIARRLGIDRIEHLSEEAAIALWGLNMGRYSLGSNSRVRALRARRELGWQPRHASAVEWIEREMRLPAA
ncbi:NAD-dependent epimerase/dehydratase family protein [Herbaspirillum sp.]|uniref:NAD-dependent epimerase/dehydratase family protein n=1 Tax=Herbaspirillum sp. TaxID=1890675 RepID=UPI001B2C5EB0|nr:NAD-dependent epimerase/dehydratase family protein [Herbaspirillum sp.]MBO9536282.1 NAD-dependent epimerase/dehydratase family protein [Herbaspirillum sp.]